jgi:excisionase family DNA binding protein
LRGGSVSTLDILQAAHVAKCHPDTLRKMAKAGEVPATKIGRAWVFPADLLEDWIKSKCPSIAAHAVPSGGSGLAERLARARAQRTERKPRSSKRFSRSGSGGKESSGTVVLFRGEKWPSDG